MLGSFRPYLASFAAPQRGRMPSRPPRHREAKSHPPFQIDGNFGGASGIAEMLLQCDEDEIRLLPALPSAWPSGHVTGLRARGGFEVDISWKDRAVERVTVRSLRGGSLRLRRRETLRTVGTTAPGTVLVFESENLRRVPR